MTEELKLLISDLAAEQRVLTEALGDLASEMWDQASSAEGWTLRDCVVHLAETDESAALAVRGESPAPRGPRSGPLTSGQMRSHGMAPSEVLNWYRTAAANIVEVLENLKDAERPSWAGRPMSALSFTSARLMEHWSHGLDILEVAGVEPVDTDRLRHVAHLGYMTRDFAFRNHDLAPASDPFYLELTAPSGAIWSWGPPDAKQRIAGTAGDFCRVVTQRIHWSDTKLQASGMEAQHFLAIAQAFAGPPGRGRPPRD